MLDEDRRVREQLRGGGHQDECQRPPKMRDPSACQRHRATRIRHQRHGELAQASIDDRRHRLVPLGARVCLGDAEDVADRRRRRGLEDAAVRQTGMDRIAGGGRRIERHQRRW